MKSAFRYGTALALAAVLTLGSTGCEERADPRKPPQPITGQANDDSSAAFKDGGASASK